MEHQNRYISTIHTLLKYSTNYIYLSMDINHKWLARYRYMCLDRCTDRSFLFTVQGTTAGCSFQGHDCIKYS